MLEPSSEAMPRAAAGDDPDNAGERIAPCGWAAEPALDMIGR
jgi:hypothetical protein